MPFVEMAEKKNITASIHFDETFGQTEHALCQ